MAKETHRVAVIRKTKHTSTLASAFVRDLDSRDTYSIKFQGTNDVNKFMKEIDKGNVLIVEGHMETSKYGPELSIQSFEILKRKATN